MRATTPNADYGQHENKLADLLVVYRKAGGRWRRDRVCEHRESRRRNVQRCRGGASAGDRGRVPGSSPCRIRRRRRLNLGRLSSAAPVDGLCAPGLESYVPSRKGAKVW